MAETLKVRLAAHRVAFYDPINRIYLAKGLKGEAEISASANLQVVRAALKSGGLILVAGTLPPEDGEAALEQAAPIAAEPAKVDQDPEAEVETEPEAAPVKTKGGRKKG